MRYVLLGVALPVLAAAQGGSSARSEESAKAELLLETDLAEPDWADGYAEGPAPTVGGPAGLLRARTADVGPPGSFRIGLHIEMFSKSDFLVQGDEHTRFVGNLAVAVTPLPWLEGFFFTQSSSNENSARRQQDDDVILALGDFGFGAKARFGKGYFWAGPEASLRFLNSVGGTTPDLSATNFYLGGVATFDPTGADFPVRAHMNLGFQWDQSRNLCPTDADGACRADEFEPVERLVEEYGQGLNRSRLQLALGFDWPIAFHKGHRFRPVLEYHLAVVTGDEDAGFLGECQRDQAFADICGLGRDSQILLLGARMEMRSGLFASAAFDVGLASPGAEFGPAPAVPPWNFLLGVGYAHDPRSHVRVVKAPSAAKPAEPIVGRVRGVVLDTGTQEPIPGAVITFTGKNVTGLATDPDGGFLSYEFPPGPLAMAIRHPDYETVKTEVSLEAGKDIPLEVRLKLAEPAEPEIAPGVRGRVSDSEGAPLKALLRIQGPVGREVATEDDGSFSADLPAGDYAIRFEAAGYLAAEQSIQVQEEGVQTLAVVLSKRPAVSQVQVAGNRIILKRKVQFGTGNARIRPDSVVILDELADLLLGRPDIKRVRIEGHTDSRGSRGSNKRLSQNRADAVRSYLVQRGVPGDTLEAVGYGSSKPIAPNLGRRNRAKNRRVEIRILD